MESKDPSDSGVIESSLLSTATLSRLSSALATSFITHSINFLFLLCTIFSLSFSAALPAKTLEYIYIDASEGSASGGHTALRFGKETFHFQHYDGGIIRLVKHLSSDFDYQYRYLENRSFHQASIELNKRHYERLHEHFNLQFLQQKQQNALLKEIRLNIALLTQQTTHPLLNIKGAGLFDSKTTAPSPTNLWLQQQIIRKYGADALDNKILAVKHQINSLQLQPWVESELQLNEDSFTKLPYSFASRHINAVSQLLLLEAIKKGATLNSQYYFSPDHADFKLTATQREQLEEFQQTLIDNLVSLLDSQRPDWGNAGLVLYARILSLAHTIQSGTFVFLDTYTTQSTGIPNTEVASYNALFKAQKDQAIARIKDDKKQLFTAGQAISEADYSRFEMLSNYYYERERGLADKHVIRISGEQRLPQKSIPLPEQLFPQFTAEQTEQALLRLEGYQKSHRQQIQALYQYDLFTRNCVTEIFTTIDKAAIDNEQIRELGQLIQQDLIAFIPFGSYRSLSIEHPRLNLPSFRKQQITKMYGQENNLQVFLREFNTLSASHYKFNDQDSVFLFFTDDKIWSRPVYGAFNLLTATGISLYGGFSLPFDSGKALKNGAMGFLMSLPELAFFNIRKGSYKHLLQPPTAN